MDVSHSRRIIRFKLQIYTHIPPDYLVLSFFSTLHNSPATSFLIVRRKKKRERKELTIIINTSCNVLEKKKLDLFAVSPVRNNQRRRRRNFIFFKGACLSDSRFVKFCKFLFSHSHQDLK